MVGRIDFTERDEYHPPMDMADDTGKGHAGDRATRIGVVPIPGFALMSYASLVEPFRAANLLAGEPLYEVVNLAPDDAPVTSSGGAEVRPAAVIGSEGPLDYLFVVAGGDPMAVEDGRLFAWLRRRAREGVTLGGVSGGPVILARAGLMAGRRMTVHWEHADALAEMDPGLVIERTLFVIDRDRVTCAGGTAALDLAHALIARAHGAAFARRVSDWFLHTEIRPPVGPQRAGLAARLGTTDPAVLAAVRAMEDHIADTLSLAQLAAIAGVTPRHLGRLFRRRLGVTVMEHYRRLRLEKARSLIVNAPLSLTEIAVATGFAGLSHFSRAFREVHGMAPSSLRRRPDRPVVPRER